MSTDETVALLSGDNETILELDNEILDVTNVTEERYNVTYVMPNTSSMFEVNATTEIDSFYFYEVRHYYDTRFTHIIHSFIHFFISKDLTSLILVNKLI